ncbi:MAG: DNA alkylation repair protein [Opitutales bacterium]|nr:DNA alkylation repair protein [Opitutales bacterium]MCH8541149.1 DNA alkylation repair protein [Opitutales bacterium]
MKKPSHPLLIELDRVLQDSAEPEYRATIRDHFRSNVDQFYGVRMPVIRECAASVVSPKIADLQARWELCDELTATGIFEHKIAAFHLAREARKQWTEKDLPRFAGWLHEKVDDWMDTDDLCIRVIGEYFLRFPDQAQTVDDWSQKKNPWSRRGSAVALIPSARRGKQWELVGKVAERLMNDHEPLVAKACGWLLKDATRQRPQEVRQLVESAGDRMLPIVRRTALAKLPKS